MRKLRQQKRWRKLVYLWDLMRELVGRDMKIQYKRSVLGIAWSFITPLMQLVVYYFIFRSVLSLNISNYAAFIFTGMLVWNWFQTSLFQGAGVITNSRELIRQPGFPVAILPVVPIATNIINFLMSLPILLVFLGNTWVQPSLFLLPVLIIIQFILTLSLTYLVAALNVTFRDTQHILGVLLTLFFFLNPIFYDMSNLPAKSLAVYNLNPLAHLITAYRAILLEGKSPNLMPLLLIGLISFFLVSITYKGFCRASHHFAEEL